MQHTGCVSSLRDSYIFQRSNLLFNFDALAQGSDFKSIEMTPVAFFWCGQDSKDQAPASQQTECLPQTIWAIEDQVKNFNSITRPSSELTFSPLDAAGGIGSHLALVIYIFVVFIWCSDTKKWFRSKWDRLALHQCLCHVTPRVLHEPMFKIYATILTKQE